MGIGGMGIWQLLIILVIVILLFGTKRLGSIGSDLGKAIKGFKKSVNDDEGEKDASAEDTEARRNVEDGTDEKAQSEKSDAKDKTHS